VRLVVEGLALPVRRDRYGCDWDGLNHGGIQL
jgi:hypothetical protein